MRWRYASAQVTGSAHEKLRKPCQDRAVCVTDDESATLLAVLADGAGTAELAHEGAETAVDTALAAALLGVRAGRRDYADILRESAALARQRVMEAAHARSVPPRELASTLLAVIVGPLGGAALQVGDGGIVIGERGPGWRCVFWPQKGEYANSTFFLSDERALEVAEVTNLSDDVVDVALLSDGVEPLALHFASRSAHEPFFRSVFAPLYAVDGEGESIPLSGGLRQLLDSPAARARTDDDATLVLATRRGVMSPS